MRDEWFYKSMGEVGGPCSGTELRRLVESGIIDRDTFVRKSTTDWTLAERVSGLFDAVNRTKTASEGDEEGGHSGMATMEAMHAAQTQHMSRPIDHSERSSGTDADAAVTVRRRTRLFVIIAGFLAISIVGSYVYLFTGPVAEFEQVYATVRTTFMSNDYSPDWELEDDYRMRYVIQEADGYSSVPYIAEIVGESRRPSSHEWQVMKFRLSFKYDDDGRMGKGWYMDRTESLLESNRLGFVFSMADVADVEGGSFSELEALPEWVPFWAKHLLLTVWSF